MAHQMINQKRASMEFAALVGIIIGIMLFTGCAVISGKILGSYQSAEAEKAFGLLGDMIEKIGKQPEGARDSVLFTIDDDAAIFAFAKNTEELRWEYSGSVIVPVPSDAPLNPDEPTAEVSGGVIASMKRPAGCPMDRSCLCRCKKADVSGSKEIICSAAACMQLSSNIIETKKFEDLGAGQSFIEITEHRWNGGFGIFKDSEAMLKAFLYTMPLASNDAGSIKKELGMETIPEKSPLYIEKRGEGVAVCFKPGC